MLRDSLESAKLIVEWNESPAFRREVAQKAQELLEFEAVWVMLAAYIGDGMLVVKSDEEAAELRDLLKASGALRGRLRMLIRSADGEN